MPNRSQCKSGTTLNIASTKGRMIMEWLKHITDTTVPLENYRDKAASWETCVIGEARKVSLTTVIPGLDNYLHNPVKGPDDDTLRNYGMDFYSAVKKGNRTRALTIYMAIQTRLARLAGFSVTRRKRK